MTTNNAPGLYLDSGEFVPAAELAAKPELHKFRALGFIKTEEDLDAYVSEMAATKDSPPIAIRTPKNKAEAAHLLRVASLMIGYINQMIDEAFPPVPAPVPTSATGGDWMQPTTVAQRMGDVLQLLCGGKRPANDVIEGWLNTDLDDCRLQDFCATHGPAWAQGIALIDLAMVAVEQPTEGVEHEMVEAPAVAQMEAIAEVIEELENDGNGWCAKVRWLYNPIPTGELLYWPQPATAEQAPVDAQQQGGA